MDLVFYDTETTGISTAFDQILQFAAIRTDSELNELDRVEMRCRLLPHVVPHPSALMVTGMSIGRVTDPALPCHYEMMCAIRAKLKAWSPAIFVGYNSMKFDEHLLRQALFRTLHEPYLTNTDGNCRADVMTLVQAASQCAPACLEIPAGAKGKALFKLDELAPANGYAHENAHDALADVEATIHLARCVKLRAPECWERFLRFSSKGEVVRFIESEHSFVLTEFYYNRPFHFPVGRLGADPDNPSAQLCFDLRHDLEWVSSLSDLALADWVAKSPKPVRRVRVNGAPAIAPIDGVPPHFLGGMTQEQVALAGARLRQDMPLQRRLIEAVSARREEFVSSPHVEEQIYAHFIPAGDKRLMKAFHEAPWEERASIVAAFKDERLRYYGYRLIYEHHPDLLSADLRSFYRNLDRDRLMDGSGQAKWNTLSGALAAISKAKSHCTLQQAHMLNEYEAWLVTRVEGGEDECSERGSTGGERIATAAGPF